MMTSPLLRKKSRMLFPLAKKRVAADLFARSGSLGLREQAEKIVRAENHLAAASRGRNAKLRASASRG